MRLQALANDGSRRELQIEEVWPHKGYLVMKFAGVDSISAAETLARCELQVPAGEKSKLDPGWTYVSDLVGCVVFDGAREIGRVEDVQFGTGEAPLLIVRGGSKGAESKGAESKEERSKEYEIPFAEAYLKNTDLARKRIQMSLPEGMLELNAPLTAEEKEQQRKK
jgi:16S rRNA processing protein RimM